MALPITTWRDSLQANGSDLPLSGLQASSLHCEANREAPTPSRNLLTCSLLFPLLSPSSCAYKQGSVRNEVQGRERSCASLRMYRRVSQLSCHPCLLRTHCPCCVLYSIVQLLYYICTCMYMRYVNRKQVMLSWGSKRS